MTTLTTPIEKISTSQVPTLMFLTTPSATTLEVVIALLVPRITKVALSGRLLSILVTTMSIGPFTFNPNYLSLSLLSLDSSIYLSHTISREIFISCTSIFLRHSSSASSDTPVISLFIKSLGLATKLGSYLDNWVNFKIYFHTQLALLEFYV